MHIVHLTPYYAPAYSMGGVVRVVEGLSQALVQRGHRVTVLTTDVHTITERTPTDAETVRDGVRVIRCRNWLYALRRVNLSSPLGMRRQAHELLPDADVLHLHEFRTVENLLVTPLAERLNVPMVLSPHGTLDTTTGRGALKQGWDGLFSASVARRVAHVVALAQAERDDARILWQQWGADAEFSIVPNGIHAEEFASLPDDTAFRQQYGIGDKRVILFMGRLHERKGVEVLARAFQQAKLANAVLVLAGPDEGMRDRLLALNVPDMILTGYLDSEARLAALAAADLFALPATGEGLSMAVLEAMGAGVPVLLSPGCHFPAAEKAGAGRIVSPQVDALSAALREMMNADLAQMGQNAKHLIHERYTWVQNAARMEAIYQQVQA